LLWLHRRVRSSAGSSKRRGCSGSAATSIPINGAGSISAGSASNGCETPYTHSGFAKSCDIQKPRPAAKCNGAANSAGAAKSN
jgi:hypothetical protein